MLVGTQPNFTFVLCFCSCLVINNSSSLWLDGVLCFKLVFVPSKTFGMAYSDSWFDLAEKQKLLCSRKQFSFLAEELFLVDSFWRRLIDKFLTSTNLFQNLWSYRSIWELQITTDCSVFDRICFSRVVCLFWWIYG